MAFVTSEVILLLFSHTSNSQTYVLIAGSYCSSRLCIIHSSTEKHSQISCGNKMCVLISTETMHNQLFFKLYLLGLSKHPLKPPTLLVPWWDHLESKWLVVYNNMLKCPRELGRFLSFACKLFLLACPFLCMPLIINYSKREPSKKNQLIWKPLFFSQNVWRLFLYFQLASIFFLFAE